MSEQELITNACNGHENTNAEDIFEVKFTNVNLEKKKVSASMKAIFNEMLEKEYNRTKAGGTSMITKAQYDEFVMLLQQYPNAKKKSQRMINTRKRYCLHSNIDGESLYWKQEGKKSKRRNDRQDLKQEGCLLRKGI
jgi:ribosomal protein S1